jgi:membrane protein required for colicin V production
MNAFDIIVIGVLGLSALFALFRGFVREAFSIGSWFGAAVATWYAFGYAYPIAQKFITSDTVAKFAAGASVFLISLILLSLIASALSSQIQHSALSSVDRALGLAFGAARGVLIVWLGFLALSWAIPEQPDWIRQARTRPFLEYGAGVLKSMIPPDLRERGQSTAKEAAATAEEAQKMAEQAKEAERLMRALDTPGPAAKPPEASATPAYKPAERKEMDRLFETNQ